MSEPSKYHAQHWQTMSGLMDGIFTLNEENEMRNNSETHHQSMTVCLRIDLLRLITT